MTKSAKPTDVDVTLDQPKPKKQADATCRECDKQFDPTDGGDDAFFADVYIEWARDKKEPLVGVCMKCRAA